MIGRGRRGAVGALALLVGAGAACSALLGIDDRSLDPGDDAAGEGGGVDGGKESATGDGPADSPSDAADAQDTGPCGDTQTSKTNCGKCGHDCLGGDCVAGVCQPVAVVPPSLGAHPWYLIADSTTLYWSDYIDQTLNRTDKTTLQTSVLYSTGGPLPNGPYGMAIDDAGIFFADNGTVYRCALSGCGASPAQLVPDDAATGGTTLYVVMDQGHVYWNESDTALVRRIAKDGGGPIDTLYAGPDSGSWLHQMVTDGTYLFVASDDGTVTRIPIDGGAAKIVNPSLEVPVAFEVTLDTSNVYWSTIDPGGATGPGNINVATKTGQTAQPIATAQAGPGGVAVDAVNIYWTAMATGGNDGAVYTCPLTGVCAPKAIATQQATPRQILVDDKYVYWTNAGNPDPDASISGSVMRLAKP